MAFKAICVNMDKDLIWKLDQIQGFSRSGFIRYILELYFDSMARHINESKNIINNKKGGI